MAWTNPRTWTTGELVTASIMNTHVRDNLKSLFGASVLSQIQVLEPGISGQRRAGRVLTATDFTQMGLAAPVGLWNLGDLTDASGNSRTLSNRGSVAFGSGITAAATEAAIFTGGDKALYRADEAALSIGYGSWGCWFRNAKRGVLQALMAKTNSAQTSRAWLLGISSGNVPTIYLSGDGSSWNISSGKVGSTDVVDDRWHCLVVTWDGSVVRLYVDGRLDAAHTGDATGKIADDTGPLNLGAHGADASTAAGNTYYGRIDEAFVTDDVLTEDQIRLLYAYKVAHGAASPTAVDLSVYRRRRGSPLATSDFPTAASVDRLYNFTAGALTDAGADNTSLTANGSIAAGPGADGETGDGYQFDGTDDYLSATDTGVPSGTNAGSIGCWLRTTTAATAFVLNYGTVGAERAIKTNASGAVTSTDGVTDPTGPTVNDGNWHHVVAVYDNAAGDGLKQKLFVDGKLVATATTFASTTLAGANAFRVGVRVNGSNFWKGGIDGVFVTAEALTGDQVAKLYAVGAQSLGASPKNAGDHVERIDSTDLYLVLDTVESSDLVDVRVRG